MIDPFDVTKYDRDRWDLEAFLIFCICVANKRADQTADKVNKFLPKSRNVYPLEYLKILQESNGLDDIVKYYKFGQYSRIVKIFQLICEKDIYNLSFEELIEIPGIGAKTAHYFLLHSREGYEGAALDTHMLRHLRENGIDTPKNTPPYGPKYIELELEFKKLWKREEPDMTLADYDLHLWKKYSISKQKEVI